MKKVLFLITKSNWGGAQRYVFDLATNLDSSRFEPVVALGGDGELAEKLKAAGIRVIHIQGLQRDISFKKELRSFWQIAKIIRQERPGVLHVNSSKAGGIGAFLGRLLRVPVVLYTAHGWAFNESRSGASKLVVGFFHWLTILLAHRTITVSDCLKAQMRWPMTQRKMTTIHLGRTITNFKSRDDARQLIEMRAVGTEYGLVDFHNDTWIGTIAELHPIKNLPVAIDAVATLIHAFPRLRYVIIGDGETRAALTEQIAHLGLAEHVFLVGKLEEAARLLKAFDLFVLPSLSEAAGYVVLEAGLAAVPVVATNVGGIPEFITPSYSGLLVPPNAVDALMQAIKELLENPDKAADLAATFSETATTFSIERMVSETERVYQTQ